MAVFIAVKTPFYLKYRLYMKNKTVWSKVLSFLIKRVWEIFLAALFLLNPVLSRIFASLKEFLNKTITIQLKVYHIQILLIIAIALYLLYRYFLKRKHKNNPDKISKKQIEILKSLSKEEKSELRQFFNQDKTTLPLENTITIQLLADKKVIDGGSAGFSDRSAGKTYSYYSLSSWALYYLLENRELLK